MPLPSIRHRGYWIDQHYLISRKGWFNRETLYLPIRNLQTVSFDHNFLDRRLGLASLTFDTAGQANTGGGTIHNLPSTEARALQEQLARQGVPNGLEPGRATSFRLSIAASAIYSSSALHLWP